ncbi:MAG: tRNA (adenosine(37)-N6)-dimethylallyltransferase MiaA [Actinomycetota bacterium]|nr:tRNA (adenosine(37)-N6)-dimethylallyltransferase MiaA [Actinomycetota bacterium]
MTARAASRPTAERGTGPPVVAVIGPTATGKSGAAIGLARRLIAAGRPAEIVNADSMQLYVGLDVGTAKVPPDQRGAVPHHLLDVWSISRSAAVAEYQRLARECIDRLRRADTIAVLVGGSGLYVRAALDQLDFPGESPPIRARLQRELDTVGSPAMHARLAGTDPAAAAAILPGNGRRIVRALEVIELTGGPFRARMPPFASVYPAVQIGLDRDDLDARIDQRVEAMMAAGLLREVRGLLPLGLRASPTAGKALGYAQLLAVLDDEGRLVGPLEDAVAATQRGTRRFVRRQRSWFRRDPRVRWLAATDPELVSTMLTLVPPTLGE